MEVRLCRTGQATDGQAGDEEQQVDRMYRGKISTNSSELQMEGRAEGSG